MTEPSPPSTLTCSEPASLSYVEATNSAMLKQPTSTSSWPTTPGYRSPGTPSKSLYGLYLAEDYDGALAALGRFGDLYATGKLPEFSKVVDTVIAWGDEILAWHRCGRPSNGRLEGANNLLQVLRRVAHGFTNPNNYAARGLLLI